MTVAKANQASLCRQMRSRIHSSAGHALEQPAIGRGRGRGEEPCQLSDRARMERDCRGVWVLCLHSLFRSHQSSQTTRAVLQAARSTHTYIHTHEQLGAAQITSHCSAANRAKERKKERKRE